MINNQTRKCEYCGQPFVTKDDRKRFCTKQHADRARNLHPGEVADDLRQFSRLLPDARRDVLLGNSGYSVCGFDIEATHLKGNIGRILCCSFKPLGGDVYTFSGLERRFKQADNHDDGALASAIRDELEKYDIIVGWNSKNFDIKFINARNLHAGSRTKNPQYHVDGMWSWRSKAAAWSGLAAVQQFIAPGEEKTAVDWAKWMQAIGWNAKLRETAFKDIIDHCELDVRVLENVYRLMVDANVIRSIKKDGGI